MAKVVADMTKLNDRQENFCRQYIIDLNASQAAIRAGYSIKTARSIGAQLLTKVNIQTRIQELSDKTLKKLEITKDRTMKEIARLAFSDIRTLYNGDNTLKDITLMDEDAAAILAGVEIDEETTGSGKKKVVTRTKKVKLYDKIRALEMLSKHFKIFDDAPKVEVKVDISKLSKEELKTLLELKRKAVK